MQRSIIAACLLMAGMAMAETNTNTTGRIISASADRQGHVSWSYSIRTTQATVQRPVLRWWATVEDTKTHTRGTFAATSIDCLRVTERDMLPAREVASVSGRCPDAKIGGNQTIIALHLELQTGSDVLDSKDIPGTNTWTKVGLSSGWWLKR